MSRVLLVFGGKSAEHEVSCVSGVAIIRALTQSGHEVIPIGIDKAGNWHLADLTKDPLEASGPDVTFGIPGGKIKSAEGKVDFDVVFPVLHGPFGEDGTIQGMLEMAGVAYVGSGVLASAAGMEKDVAKRLFTAAGIPITPYEVVRAQEWKTDSSAVIEMLNRSLGSDVFVKPVEMGSSIGVSRATNPTELSAAIEGAFEFGQKVIVEERINGREIEIAVLEGNRVSVPGEIVLEVDWYDYEAKYADDRSQFIAPAALSEEQTAEVRRYAVMAFSALECKGLARVDFLLEEGGRGFLINEINTMPGFTPISGFPKMWEASGMSYTELCDELVKLAVAR
ncbi:MAG: D-alanine--D-alanine ligase [Acidimicrobiia bacterium]|nr:D-alanine--D-alanine ligase [Acidimicrobiia bacterium]MDH3470557.1 D-alanine--D-alanine ligase [Acidimicrobiia bacterium]